MRFSRFRRFSLLSLLLTVLLIGSSASLWMGWEPWTRRLVIADGRRPLLYAAFTVDDSKVVWIDVEHFAHVVSVETGTQLSVYKVPFSKVHALGTSNRRPIIVTDGSEEHPIPTEVWKPAFKLRHVRPMTFNVTLEIHNVADAVKWIAGSIGEEIELSPGAIAPARRELPSTAAHTNQRPLTILEDIADFASLELECYGNVIQLVTPEESATHREAKMPGPYVWDLETGYLLEWLGQTKGETICALSVSQDGSHLMAATSGLDIYTWALNGGHPSGSMRTQLSPISVGVLSNNARRTAALCLSGGELGAWDIEHGTTLIQSYVDTSPVALGISPDGDRAIFSFGDRSAELWNLSAKALLVRYRSNRAFYDESLDPVFTSDGRRAVISNNDGTQLIDPRDGRIVAVLSRLERAESAGFSSDGRLAASYPDRVAVHGDDGGELLAALPERRRLDQLTGRVEATIPLPLKLAALRQPPQFSADGQLLLARAEGSLGVWSFQRPEGSWGFLALPAFWTTAFFGIALLVNLRGDGKRSARAAATAK